MKTSAQASKPQRPARAQTLRRLRERIAHTPVNRRGRKRYSAELRQDLVSYAASRNATGESFKQVATELGLPAATLVHWCEGPGQRKPRSRPVGFRPVSLQADAGLSPATSAQRSVTPTTSSQPVVVLPDGVRIEGLTTDEVVEFVRSLGCLS